MSQEFDERCWWCDADLEGQVLTEHIKKHPVTKFEAEVSNMVSVADFCDHFCCDLPANVCRVRTLAKEIICLLTNERKPMECGHPKACWIHEDSSDPDKRGVFYEKGWCSACAERERVREMCAEVIAAEGRLWNRNEHPAVDDALHAVYVDIGKLDLTKDLAPSREEHGKPGV